MSQCLAPQVPRTEGWSWAAVRAFIPAVGRPHLTDQATYGDDGVGEVEEGVDGGGPALVALGEAVEDVLPGVGALHVPPLAGLDRRLLAFVRDPAVQASFVEQGAGLVGVVVGVQVDGGPRSSRRSRVGESSGESWGLAPARTRPSAMP